MWPQKQIKTKRQHSNNKAYHITPYPFYKYKNTCVLNSWFHPSVRVKNFQQLHLPAVTALLPLLLSHYHNSVFELQTALASISLPPTGSELHIQSLLASTSLWKHFQRCYFPNTIFCLFIAKSLKHWLTIIMQYFCAKEHLQWWPIT